MAKILVIDDDPSLRFTVREMLALLGHQAIEAKDGREGLIAAAASAPDLVICDIYMPEHEGLATIRELRRRHQGVPILAISGHNSFFLQLAERLGAEAGLPKPFTVDQLGRWVNRLLHGENRVPQTQNDAAPYRSN